MFFNPEMTINITFIEISLICIFSACVRTKVKKSLLFNWGPKGEGGEALRRGGESSPAVSPHYHRVTRNPRPTWAEAGVRWGDRRVRSARPLSSMKKESRTEVTVPAPLPLGAGSSSRVAPQSSERFRRGQPLAIFEPGSVPS